MHGEGCCFLAACTSQSMDDEGCATGADCSLVAGSGELTPKRTASSWIAWSNCLYGYAEYSFGKTDIFSMRLW